MSPAYISICINIPHRQSLRTEVKGLRKQTLLQTTTVVERRTILLKRYQRFLVLQQLYMPGFNHAERASATDAPTHIEDFILYLPSDLGDAERRKYCVRGLVTIEDRLRFAEATDQLERCRHHLRTRSFANKFKLANVTGQTMNTRARESQNRIDDRVRAAAIRYRRARAAMKTLRGPGAWEETLRVLNKADVRALNERELTQLEKNESTAIHLANGVVTALDVEEERRLQTAVSVGDGQRTPSWIWFTGLSAEKLNDPSTRKGTSCSPCNTAQTDLISQHSALNGLRLRLVLRGG